MAKHEIDFDLSENDMPQARRLAAYICLEYSLLMAKYHSEIVQQREQFLPFTKARAVHAATEYKLAERFLKCCQDAPNNCEYDVDELLKLKERLFPGI